MNMFYLASTHITNARYHVDAHVGKIILEVAQMMCIPYHLQGIGVPYKKSHENHPTSKWVRESWENYIWTGLYASALHDEFQYRRNKKHKSYEVVKWCIDNIHKLKFDKIESTPFALAMPEQYRTSCPIESYRNYYRNEKSHLFKWTNRERPDWL